MLKHLRRPIALAAITAASQALAQGVYPARPVRMIVPFPPGGGTDIIARHISQRLGDRLGQPVLIDNRPGAGTNIGMEAVAKAAPDGYTLLMGTITLAANASLYRKLPFDPQRDLAPITLVANAPTLLVAHGGFATTGAADLVARSKRAPGTINSASYGTGSGAHLAAELFRAVTGADLVHIPYKGGGPAVTATVAGEVQVLFASVLPVLGQVKAGKLRPLALAARARSPLLPDVPTFAEGGIAYETGTWFGMLAPAGTPAPIIERLHAEAAAVLREPEVRQRIIAEGAEVIASTPAEFAAFVTAESERWSRIVRAAKITSE